MTASMNRTRAGALALAVAGFMFILYPAARPWHDETTVDGATRSMSSNWWVAAHLFAMIGFILVPLGLLALRSVVQRSRAEWIAAAAVLTAWVGAGLTLPYYGAEDFGLHAIAGRARSGQLDLLDLVHAVRYGPVAATTFGVGLTLLGVGAILAAVAVARSGVLPPWSGVVFAIAFALLIPQFFTGAGVRITHGVITAVGLCWLALAIWRAAPGTPREPVAPAWRRIASTSHR
jgi:hypothetical protein